jgi:hypothetical protein
MPWWPSRRAEPSQPDAASGPASQSAPSVPPATDAPSAITDGSSVRFRVEDVFTVIGTGCVLGGRVEVGILRPPTTMRLTAGEFRVGPETPLRVIRAIAARKPVSELPPGVRAGLEIRGLNGEHPWPLSRHIEWPVKRGDCLVSP